MRIHFRWPRRKSGEIGADVDEELRQALSEFGNLDQARLALGRTDPWRFVAAGLMVGAVAALAAWIPARRATRVDPLEALRSE